MTKVSYDIYFGNVKVKTVATLDEARAMVAEIGSKATYKAVYSELVEPKEPYTGKRVLRKLSG